MAAAGVSGSGMTSGPNSANVQQQWEVFDSTFRSKTTTTNTATTSPAAVRFLGSTQEEQKKAWGRGHESARKIDDAGGGDGSRMFAWSVLLHGCLCEAPLAVTEGLLRAPLYLLAAAWVEIVGLVGASRRQHQADLSNQAAALAREGLLLLSASLTLAVPFSAAFTVYRDVEADLSDWDVRPVPTVLGAVDPLRFFVFALGQAGELGANGNPEPLEGYTPAYPCSTPSSSSSASTFFTGGDDGVELGLSAGRRCDAGSLEMAAVARFHEGGSNGNSSLLPPFATRYSRQVGGIAAQSMDTDRLGVGILHPPKVIRLRLRRGGESARRTAVSTYRKIATSVRRFRNKSSTLARASSSSNADGTSAAVGY